MYTFIRMLIPYKHVCVSQKLNLLSLLVMVYGGGTVVVVVVVVTTEIAQLKTEREMR